MQLVKFLVFFLLLLSRLALAESIGTAESEKAYLRSYVQSQEDFYKSIQAVDEIVLRYPKAQTKKEAENFLFLRNDVQENLLNKQKQFSVTLYWSYMLALEIKKRNPSFIFSAFDKICGGSGGLNSRNAKRLSELSYDSVKGMNLSGRDLDKIKNSLDLFVVSVYKSDELCSRATNVNNWNN